MGFWRSVANAFTGDSWSDGAGYNRAQFAADETPPRPIDHAILEFNNLGGVVVVSRDEAMTVPAVKRARDLICQIATLPLVQYDTDNRVVRNPLFEQIDPNVTNSRTLTQTVEDLIFDGVAWWRITTADFDGYPLKAVRVDPTRVSENEDTGEIRIDGKIVPHSEVIQFLSNTAAMRRAAGRVIRLASMLDKAAIMYAQEPRPIGILAPIAKGQGVPQEELDKDLEAWRTARNTRGTAYLENLEYIPVDMMSPADLQLIELRQQASLDIANAFGLDPEDLGVSTTSRTYQNAVDRRQDRINDVLSLYMEAITERLSMGDVTRRGHTVRFDLDDYLRASPQDRFGVYKTAKEIGAMTVDEIRAEERMPALTGQQKRELAPAPQAPTVTADSGVEASGPAAVTFSGGPRGTFEFDAALEFTAVDEDSRTITGLAVPYGQVARNGGRQWRFQRGSIKWSAEKRIKLLRDHDYTQALGYATKLTDTPEGLVATFKVARGKAGDEALALAADGVLDGLSIGVDFTDDGFVKDPDNAATYLVHRAALREVSLTAMPAFDDSRLTSVKASQHEGNEMTDAIEPQAPAAPAIAPEHTFNAAQVAQMMAAMAAGNGTVGIHPAPEGRQVVNPTRVAMTSVNEATPYRFDARGNIQRGTHDFSMDLIAGSKGDAAALERAETFMRAQFDVDRADVPALNPNRQRPDLYVDQREYRYPVWEAINKGTLADSTPFVFPKFNTASGLVNAHTEGTEPTPGTFTATSQTVTPTAVSGKVEITREAWDQGGNPQLSNLIWRQMTRAYYEALEASAVAVLDAATPTAIALTAGGGTTGQTLDAELTAAFAALQFIRGGFSMDTMFTQVDLYKALVAAKDTTGRRLYPALGPSNASGTVRSRFAAIDVNGVTALPSWALAATGSVVASSYLFDSESVHGWATAPQRLDFQYRVAYVDLAIWGYKATAVSDINGVREITFDPVA